MSVEIVALLASPVHRYAGRPSDGPAPAPDGELVDAIEVRANRGIVGDRYFARPAHRDAGVTLIGADAIAGADLRTLRRNVLLRGVDVDALVGSTVALDSGRGEVVLQVHRPARPCAWMDTEIGPGTRAALRGRGGVRCEPLSDGSLALGPVTLRVIQ